MANLPKSDMILVGFLIQINLSKMISREIEEETWYDRLICRNGVIIGFLHIALAGSVAFVTAILSKEKRVTQGTLTFVGSFILTMSADKAGYMAFICSKDKDQYSYLPYLNPDFRDHKRETNLYIYNLYLTIPIMALTSVVIVVDILNRATPPEPEQNTNCPDPETMLLGVCMQSTIWKCVSAIPFGTANICIVRGMYCWLELLAISGILVLLTAYRISSQQRCRIPRLWITFFCSFVINFSSNDLGSLAYSCASTSSYSESGNVLHRPTMLLNSMAALWFTIIFIKKNPDQPQNPDPILRNSPVITDSSSRPPSYSSQVSYPPELSYALLTSHPPQESYILDELGPPPEYSEDPPPPYSERTM